MEGRDGARKRRTFEYDGSQVTLWQHLKIGVKDSVAETSGAAGAEPPRR